MLSQDACFFLLPLSIYHQFSGCPIRQRLKNPCHAQNQQQTDHDSNHIEGLRLSGRFTHKVPVTRPSGVQTMLMPAQIYRTLPGSVSFKFISTGTSEANGSRLSASAKMLSGCRSFFSINSAPSSFQAALKQVVDRQSTEQCGRSGHSQAAPIGKAA